MKRLLLTALLFSTLPLPAMALSPAESYAAGLAAEKAAGDKAAAIDHYREVLQQYRAGRADQILAARARQRLDVLGEQSILESPLSPRLPFQRLGDRLGVTPDERLPPSGGLAPGGSIGGFPLGPRRTQPGANGIAGSPSQDPLEAISQQIRALRYALGINGLLEYVEELVANSRRSQPPALHELYQAGLIAERQQGNLEEALAFYRRALADRAIEPALRRRIDRRLARCRERLARRGDLAPGALAP